MSKTWGEHHELHVFLTLPMMTLFMVETINSPPHIFKQQLLRHPKGTFGWLPGLDAVRTSLGLIIWWTCRKSSSTKKCLSLRTYLRCLGERSSSQKNQTTVHFYYPPLPFRGAWSCRELRSTVPVKEYICLLSLLCKIWICFFNVKHINNHYWCIEEGALALEEHWRDSSVEVVGTFFFTRVIFCGYILFPFPFYCFLMSFCFLPTSPHSWLIHLFALDWVMIFLCSFYRMWAE